MYAYNYAYDIQLMFMLFNSFNPMSNYMYNYSFNSNVFKRPVPEIRFTEYKPKTVQPLKFSTPELKLSKPEVTYSAYKQNKENNNTNSQRVYSNNPNARKLGPEFLAKVKKISANINCDYRDLLALMNGESGLNPQAVNKNGGATGLIQFMPKTAKSLGTSTEALYKMSAMEQLDYVEKYFLRANKTGERLTAGKLGALCFLPGRANRENLTTSNEAYYKHNSSLDLNGDGVITTTELGDRIKRKSVNLEMFA